MSRRAQLRRAAATARFRTASIRSANSMPSRRAAPFWAIAADGCIGATGRSGGRRWTSKRWIVCVCAFKGPAARRLGRRLHRALLSRRADGARGRPPPLFRMPARGGEGLPRRLSRRRRRARTRWTRSSTANGSTGGGSACGGRRSPRCPTAPSSRSTAVRMRLRGGTLRPWSFAGYGAATAFEANAEADVLTPPSTVAALAAGYRPVWALAPERAGLTNRSTVNTWRQTIREDDMLRVLMASAAVLAASVVGAAAGDATGVWLRDNGASKVRIAPCGGEALCGAIIWLKDPSGPAKVGQQVFFDMKPHGENVWTGLGLQSRRRQDLFGQDDPFGRPSHHRGLRVRRPDLQVGLLDPDALGREPARHAKLRRRRRVRSIPEKHRRSRSRRPRSCAPEAEHLYANAGSPDRSARLYGDGYLARRRNPSINAQIRRK